MKELIQLGKISNDTARTPKERDEARNKIYEMKMKEIINKK